MGWNLVLAVLKWGTLILLIGFIVLFGKSFVFYLIKKHKQKTQKELKETEIIQKNKKIHPETLEILTNLEKVKAQAILDKKTHKYEKKNINTKPKTLKKN